MTQDERKHRADQQAIEVEHEQQKYRAAQDAYRWGTRKIVADAREEIAKLRFDRDEARLRLRRERHHLDFLKREAEKPFDGVTEDMT